MDENHIKLVQQSFTRLVPHSMATAQAFYRRLFELDPELRSMFTGNLEVQGRMFMKVLASAVNSLYDVESLEPMLHELGKRHLDYGTTPEHYKLVEEALIQALSEQLGDDFNDEVETSWRETYWAIASKMQEAKKD